MATRNRLRDKSLRKGEQYAEEKTNTGATHLYGVPSSAPLYHPSCRALSLWIFYSYINSPPLYVSCSHRFFLSGMWLHPCHLGTLARQHLAQSSSEPLHALLYYFISGFSPQPHSSIFLRMDYKKTSLSLSRRKSFSHHKPNPRNEMYSCLSLYPYISLPGLRCSSFSVRTLVTASLIISQPV